MLQNQFQGLQINVRHIANYLAEMKRIIQSGVKNFSKTTLWWEIITANRPTYDFVREENYDSITLYESI